MLIMFYLHQFKMLLHITYIITKSGCYDIYLHLKTFSLTNLPINCIIYLINRTIMHVYDQSIIRCQISKLKVIKLVFSISMLQITDLSAALCLLSINTYIIPSINIGNTRMVPASTLSHRVRQEDTNFRNFWMESVFVKFV